MYHTNHTIQPKRIIVQRRPNFLWLSFIAFFILGWLASNVYGSFYPDLWKFSLSGFFSKHTASSGTDEAASSLFTNDRSSPADRLNEYNVQLGDSSVVLNLDRKPRLSRFTDTNSMDPVFDKEANALEINPQTPYDIKVGDIISYQTGDGVVVHRVVEIDSDNKGIYYITKGDNNPIRDFERIRFEQVVGVVVAIVY